MKLDIVKDGQIQGWFTASALTAITWLLLILGFLFDAVSERWEVMGDQYRAIYLGSLGIFFVARVAAPGVQAVVTRIIDKTKSAMPPGNGGENVGEG